MYSEQERGCAAAPVLRVSHSQLDSHSRHIHDNHRSCTSSIPVTPHQTPCACCPGGVDIHIRRADYALLVIGNVTFKTYKNKDQSDVPSTAMNKQKSHHKAYRTLVAIQDTAASVEARRQHRQSDRYTLPTSVLAH